MTMISTLLEAERMDSTIHHCNPPIGFMSPDRRKAKRWVNGRKRLHPAVREAFPEALPFHAWKRGMMDQWRAMHTGRWVRCLP